MGNSPVLFGFLKDERRKQKAPCLMLPQEVRLYCIMYTPPSCPSFFIIFYLFPCSFSFLQGCLLNGLKSPQTQAEMTESNADSTINVPEIPVEIVTDEEMALIEAALTATRSSLSSSTIPAISFTAAASSSSFSPLLHRNARSIGSIARLSKRRLSDCTDTRPIRDIEDSGELRSTQKKIGVGESLLHRFRRKKGLSVTDITGTVPFFFFFYGFVYFSLILGNGFGTLHI